MAKTGVRSESSQAEVQAPTHTDLDPVQLVRGYGALRDKLMLPGDIDWTKPIYAQVLARTSEEERSESSAA